MSKEYIRNKSWVELMEEELEEERRNSEVGELEGGNDLKGRLEENKEILKEQNKNFLVKEEKLGIKRESLETRDLVIANEQKVNEKQSLDISKEGKIDIKEEASPPATRVKVENVSYPSCGTPSTVSDESKGNEAAANHFITKEKIKIEPGTYLTRNEDSSATNTAKEIVVPSIKIKNEVEDVDDDDRLAKELDNIEHSLVQDSNKPGESLDNRMNSITEIHMFVHPGVVANGEHNTPDCIKSKTNISSSAQNSPRRNRNRKRKNSSDLGKNRRKYSCRDQSASSSSSSHSSSASDSKSTPRKEKKKVEYETDPEVLARRQKQIDYGKNTIGYDRYRQLVPKEMRGKRDPRTPPKQVKYSRRAWDGIVKIWRQQLHHWDPESDDKDSKTLPELNVSVDMTSSPYKRRIHTNTVSSGSTEDVANNDFISIDYDYPDLH